MAVGAGICGGCEGAHYVRGRGEWGGVGGDVGWCGWMDGSFGCLMFAAWEREGIVGLGV